MISLIVAQSSGYSSADKVITFTQQFGAPRYSLASDPSSATYILNAKTID
jgi:hypothetical protein